MLLECVQSAFGVCTTPYLKPISNHFPLLQMPTCIYIYMYMLVLAVAAGTLYLPWDILGKAGKFALRNLEISCVCNLIAKIYRIAGSIHG